MEHSVEPVGAEARPWRTLAVVVSVIALVELLVILAVFAARPLVHHLRDAAVAEAAKTSLPAQSSQAPAGKPKLTRAETSVIVLNGNGVAGAAGDAADRARARGYRITDVGDARRTDYPQSVVMFRPGYRAEAARLARDLRISVVGPLDGMKRRDLLGAHVALIIGG